MIWFYDISILVGCPWCYGYRRRIWTRRHEFKSWTSLIAFHIALIPLGKVGIQIFSLQLWVDMENSEFKPTKRCLKIDLMSYPARAEGLGKYGWLFNAKSILYIYI